MNPDRQYRSHLFTVRLWIEPGVPHPDPLQPGELRIKVQHVGSGEVRYFRQWPALVEFLVSVAQADEDDPADSHPPDEDGKAG